MPESKSNNRDVTIRAISVFCGLALAAGAMSAACGDDHDRPATDAAGSVDSPTGGGSDASTDAHTGGDGGASTGFQPLRVGYVNLVEGGGGQSVFATLRDKADVPPPVMIATAEDCAVWVHPGPASCEPPCGTGFCVDTDTCEAWPAFAPAGIITVTGLREPLSFVPDIYGYSPDPFTGSPDLFETGAEITASAPGDASEGFTVRAHGVAPLEAEFPITLEIEDGVDKEINWIPAGNGRIQLALVVGWHGAPYEAMLLCETPDDGSLTIPGTLIAELPRATSAMEQHYSWLVRFDRDVAQTSAGPVELFVGSMVIITQLSHP